MAHSFGIKKISDRHGNVSLISERPTRSDITPALMSDALHALTLVVIAVYKVTLPRTVT